MDIASGTDPFDPTVALLRPSALTAPDVIEKNAALARSGGLPKLAEKLAWPALPRKLDRVSPDYRN